MITHNWHLIDLKGQNLGRISTQIAKLLMGKHKADFAPNLDNGDYVVAINANEITVTGNKAEDKKYYRHSGFRKGLREVTLGELRELDSRKLIETSVKGMLPKNKLQQPQMRRLKVYRDDKHPYLKHFNQLNEEK